MGAIIGLDYRGSFCTLIYFFWHLEKKLPDDGDKPNYVGIKKQPKCLNIAQFPLVNMFFFLYIKFWFK